jgi:hypothetical protein
MKMKIRVSYSVNGGNTLTKDLDLDVADDFVLNDMSLMGLMSRAADLMVDEGQIMISELVPVGEPELVGAF